MSERERFEAWYSTTGARFWNTSDAAFAAWCAALARSGQAASGSSQGARSDDKAGVGVGQPEAPTAAPLEPAAWADDRAIAGGIGNVVSAATKAYWERSHTIDRAMAARMVHPLYAHPPARSGAGSEEARDAARYRWLRAQSYPWGKAWFSLVALDVQVDAAMAGSEEGQG